ncbi:hypothetical protein [Marinifilum caeruleilacunae]|uniref:Peptidase C39-like domain-containing protein n=1 Tax=Marinifilum caeruleilacunae TaxID=2499076 RepID=A0ABX1WRI4_9BACT|nr:hypothetical protein [Marinifilum caeruleilacunae]NOU58704.1 hypothetical protein [Marinifilum caeruleilacunae]
MKLNKLFIVLLTFVSLFCGKDHTQDETITIDFECRLQHDRIQLDANASFSELTDNLEYKWELDDSQIYLNQKDQKVAFFILPDRETESEISVQLVIDDGKNDEILQKRVTIPPFNDHIAEWGLGEQSINRKSNDQEYNWYFEQSNTGQYSSENCGPSCVTMALKWAIKDWDKDVEHARSQYHPFGGWWWTYDIIDYLNVNDVTNKTVPFNTQQNIRKYLDDGLIAILCIDMHQVRLESKPEHRIDKYYETRPEWGHFIIVKGYRQTDKDVFFEIYDPGGRAKMYEDGSFKGKNRYYRERDLMNAAHVWWKYAIIVSRSLIKTKSAVDPNTIEHARGR